MGRREGGGGGGGGGGMEREEGEGGMGREGKRRKMEASETIQTCAVKCELRVRNVLSQVTAASGWSNVPGWWAEGRSSWREWVQENTRERGRRGEREEGRGGGGERGRRGEIVTSRLVTWARSGPCDTPEGKKTTSQPALRQWWRTWWRHSVFPLPSLPSHTPLG